jgi:uncharacterized protein
MPYAYITTPFLAWLAAGSLKFLVNCLRERRLAFDRIGYGGLPSNHSAIVASICVLVACRQGLDSPALGVAVAFGFIVLLDASSLRKQVGRHAAAINRLADQNVAKPLRERMGHTPLEIACGLVVGALVGLAIALPAPF